MSNKTKEVIDEVVDQEVAPSATLIVSSPPAKGELGEGAQVQDSLRSSKSNEWTVPVREEPKTEGVNISVTESEPTGEGVNIPVTEEPKTEEVKESEPEIKPEPTPILPETKIEEVIPESVIIEKPLSPEIIVSSPPDKGAGGFISEPVVSSPPANVSQTPNTTNQEPTPPVPIITPSISRLDRIAESFKANMARAKELLNKARIAVQVGKNKKKEKIMTLFLKKKKIKNKDVRDLLHIADPTATNYLNILVKEGRVVRVGKNKGVYYTKV